MANSDESNPLLANQPNTDDEKKAPKSATAPPEKQSPPPPPAAGATYGWTADGLPLGHGSVVGEPISMHEILLIDGLSVSHLVTLLHCFLIGSLEVWPHVCFMEAMLSDLALVQGLLQITAYLTPVYIWLGNPFVAGTSWPLGFRILAVQLSA
ncbi:hypothetical protein LOK49_LG05G00652 [Camellia lanceoleosa]|uniref:Uncharacterized protein n=1 Tax=Camellia lanceoleosa TaxID=1840588 RepID=A0ACC0HRP9_9ERIC|nr:hypothetical protein LOK49_LG05G00652 [Camellia lanceoleosa]